jgi:antitoxin ParD1/3/4
MINREQKREATIAVLRDAFRQGEDSGAPVPADEVFDRLEAKYEVGIRPLPSDTG